MTSPSARIDQSYRGLLRVPQLSRVLASMMLARVGNAMVGVAIVLFTLEAYDSPALAGLVTLAYILPGILVSPIAGALLDRHGRVRLIILDYIVSGSTLGLIALLALADQLPPGVLVLIAALASLTSILSATGLRSLFRRHRELSGAIRVRPHRLRHTYGTELASAGIDLLALRALMGHVSPETTARYVHLSVEQLAAE